MLITIVDSTLQELWGVPTMATRTVRPGITRSVALLALALCGLGFDEPIAGPNAQSSSLEEVGRKVDKMIKEESNKLKPIPLAPIPDDPPPHEGAMIEFPYIVEPPDILMVEVLEALPGRPISGERLVRSDGTITLGFYGDLYVKGLTREQIKSKLVIHLRKHMNDIVLGIITLDSTSDELMLSPQSSPPLELIETPLRLEGGTPVPSPPDPKGSSGGKTLDQGSTKSSSAPSTKARSMPPRAQSGSSLKHTPPTPSHVQRPPSRQQSVTRPPLSRRRWFRRTSQLTEPSPLSSAQQASSTQPQAPDHPTKGEPELADPGDQPGYELIRPADSERAYVDLAGYNSKHYSVIGDVELPGRYPFTGNETVLDAYNFVGGFLPTADPNEIRLVRPARGGAPARIYKIDWKAVTEQGDKSANLQIFPGDRLIVGRNAVVKTTVELNRMAETFSLVTDQLLRYTNAMRSLNGINQPVSGGTAPALTPAQREAFLKGFTELWWKYSKEGSANFDEETFREFLIRLVPQPQPPSAGPKEE
jgi:protein involved in polysaccharide export with SLBB domain